MVLSRDWRESSSADARTTSLPLSLPLRPHSLEDDAASGDEKLEGQEITHKKYPMVCKCCLRRCRSNIIVSKEDHGRRGISSTFTVHPRGNKAPFHWKEHPRGWSELC